MKTLILLSGLGIGSLIAELTNQKKLLPWVVLLGLLGAIGVSVMDWGTNIHYFNNMMAFDNTAILFTCVLCFVAFLWFLGSAQYIETETNITDQYALILFALVGAFVMVTFQHMVMLFLGIEILSLSLYVLAGSRKNDLFSNESAIKYFLMGSFATGFLLFGIALIYGVTGSFHLEVIGNALSNAANTNGLVLTGLVMMLLAMSFKVAAVPFHFWTADVYYGAPTQVTAYMATIAKTAAFAAFLRLFTTAFPFVSGVWVYPLIVISIITMLIGNMMAVYQQEVKRMLAYSSVAHAGYMLMALLSQNEFTVGSIVYYSLGYSIASLLAFNVYAIVSNGSEKNGGFDAFSGLAKRSPLLAAAALVSMLSLAGIPPLAGFFGKYYVFASALEGGHRIMVLFAVLASLISIYYYFKIIIKTFAGEEKNHPEPLVIEGSQKLMLIIGIALLILLGMAPEMIIRWH